MKQQVSSLSKLSALKLDVFKNQRMLRFRLHFVANRPVFPGTSRFSAYMSRVPAKAAPGRIMSRFSAGLYSHSKSHAEMPRKTDTYV